MKRILLAAALVAVVGCGGELKPPPLPEPLQPLSVEEWKTLPALEKYDGETLDRLRIDNPDLKSDAFWDKFFQEVVVPSRKIDVPPPTP